MKLIHHLELKKGNIVSIVGAGGKTTLLFELADELKKDYKVLVTTSTKIYLPKEKQYDYLAIGIKEFDEIKDIKSNGIYVYGSHLNEEQKLLGIDVNIDQYLVNFDFILIEADGAKEKPIKGFETYEPVVLKTSSMTIGVCNIQAIGLMINAQNVHRLNQFLKITTKKENEAIKSSDLVSVILHDKGLFKDSVGKKVLVINQVDDEKQMEMARILMGLLKQEKKFHNLIDKTIITSLKNKEYHRWSEDND